MEVLGRAVSSRGAIAGRGVLPACIDDYGAEDSPVHVVEMIVDELDLGKLGFEGTAVTGGPGYHPTTMLKLYVYG